MDIKKYNVEIIENTELVNIDGGYNFLELIAYAIGYATAAIEDTYSGEYAPGYVGTQYGV